jgi:hypothetical protein
MPWLPVCVRGGVVGWGECGGENIIKHCLWRRDKHGLLVAVVSCAVPLSQLAPPNDWLVLDQVIEGADAAAGRLCMHTS